MLGLKHACFASSPLKKKIFSQDGLTALMRASFQGNLGSVSALLARGDDPNYSHIDNGYTALMFGVISGSPAVVSALLSSGASFRARNAADKSAMDLAQFIGHHSCAEAIRSHVESVVA